ncbi:MAG: hypothetical protein H8D42_01840 [Candidatus Marinimicrobia bacterium]|nr:hypothetical protein [Candidatus Neomarinimicrobiota bacterium]MBL7067126.1 hypothetical protein [Candidatus Neomarinimicrobiota bacterium]
MGTPGALMLSAVFDRTCDPASGFGFHRRGKDAGDDYADTCLWNTVY